MEITFYKDNKKSGLYTKTIEQIITEFNATKESKLAFPFERLLLTFMMDYGSFDVITDDQWDALFAERYIQYKFNKTK